MDYVINHYNERIVKAQRRLDELKSSRYYSNDEVYHLENRIRNLNILIEIERKKK